MMPEAPETVTITRRGLAPVWTFQSPGGVLARAVPARKRTARVDLPDGRTWVILPDQADGLRVWEGEDLILSATRLDPWGKRWELTGSRSSYQLTNRSGFKGRWTMGPPGAETAELRMWTTRRMHLHSRMQVPLEVLVLAWYVIIRMAFALSSVGSMVSSRRLMGGRQAGATG